MKSKVKVQLESHYCRFVLMTLLLSVFCQHMQLYLLFPQSWWIL
ncbi:hypothetical protein RDI58_017852 [Solanum bulbocastanum]|uniref:Uncharacterized protein n=1 Tax=Solanum bulbocastanum TaxID=147425 RepID=A0AAN8TFT4_SOLBU